MADYTQLLEAGAEGGKPYEDLLAQATGGPTPEQKAQGIGVSFPLMQGAPQEAPQEGLPEAPVVNPYEEQMAAPKRETSYTQLFSGGFQRSVQGFKALPSTGQAIYHQLAGDASAAQAAAAAAQAIEDEAPKPMWELKNVGSLGDFSEWLVEKAGETVPQVLASALTGGVGGLTASLAARNIMMSTVSRRALIAAGGGIGAGLSNSALETSSTLGDLYKVTGEVHPLTSVAAGVTKGALETIVPMRLGKALFTPGTQIGLRGIGREALFESATEVAQQSVDEFLLKHHDPNYSFFGTKNELLGPGAWRMIESATAGFFLGFGMSTGAATIEKLTEPRRPEAGPGSVPPIPLSPGAGREPMEVSERGVSFSGQPYEISKIDPRPAIPPRGPEFPEGMPPAGNVNEFGIGTRSKKADVEMFAQENLRPSEYIPGAYERAWDLWGRRVPQANSTDLQEVYSAYVGWAEARGKMPQSYNEFVANIWTGEGQERQPYHYRPFPSTEGREEIYALLKRPETGEVIDASERFAQQLNQADLTNLAHRGGQREVEGITAPGGTLAGRRGRIRSKGDTQLVRNNEPGEARDYQAPPKERIMDSLEWKEDAKRWQWKREQTEPMVKDQLAVDKGGIVQTGKRDLRDIRRHEKVVRQSIQEGSGSYTIMRGGEPIGTIRAEVSGDTAYIGWMGSYEELSISDIKAIREDFRTINPKVTKFTGSRISGAHRLHAGGDPQKMKQLIQMKMQAGAPEEYVQIEPGLGPVTVLRKMVMPSQGTVDVGPEAAAPRSPQEDPINLAKVLAAMPKDLRDVHLDMLEANTERYVWVEPGGRYFGKLVMTSAEAEYQNSIRSPVIGQQQIARLDQGTLIPEAMTATPFDLPPWDDPRVWFLAGVTKAEKDLAMEQYIYLQTRMEVTFKTAKLESEERYEQAEKAAALLYDQILKMGLRVVPSRGASFLYAGTARGDLQKEMPWSKRTSVVGLWSTQSDSLVTDPHIWDSAFHNALPGDLQLFPVALDLDKFRPGEVSAVPDRTSRGWTHSPKFREGLTPEQEEQLKRDVESVIPFAGTMWTEQRLKNFVAIVRKGIYFTPGSESSRIVTTRTPQLKQLTAGTNNPTKDQERAFKQLGTVNTAFPVPKTTVGLHSTAQVMAPGSINRTTAEKLEATLKILAPWVDRALQSIGIQGGLKIEVGFDTGNSGVTPLAWINPFDGLMHFYVPEWTNQTDKWDWNRRVAQTLMHEVGHAVSYHYWNRIPPALKTKIIGAHKTAQMLHRLNRKRSISMHATPQTPDAGMAPEYFTSLVEWLAEQFRRWTLMDQQVVTELDQIFAEGGREVRAFYRAMLVQTSQQVVTNFTTPSTAFSAMMEYGRNIGKAQAKLRSAVDEAQQKLRQLTVSANVFDDDLWANENYVRIIGSITEAIKSMEHLFPKERFYIIFQEDWAGRNVEELARYTVAGEKPNSAGYLELALGAMVAGFTPQQGRIYLAHELVHTYRSLNLITPAEMQILYETAIARGKKLEPHIAAQIERQGRQWAQERGLGARMEQLIVDKMLREETIAYYVQDYANGGITDPDTQGIVEKIFQLLQQIYNKMRGLGFVTSDDVLRSFFSGEMMRRQQPDKKAPAPLSMLARASPVEGQPVTRIEQVEPGLFAFMDEVVSPQGTWAQMQLFRSEVPPTLVPNQKMGDYLGQNPGMKLAGTLTVTTTPIGMNVNMVESNEPGLAKRLYDWVEGVYQKPILFPDMLQKSGHRSLMRTYPELRKFYVMSDWDGVYLSAKEVNRMLERTTGTSQRYYRELKAKFDPEVWSKENETTFDKLFSPVGESAYLDGVQGSMVQHSQRVVDSQLMEALGNPVPAGSQIDHFTYSYEMEQRALGEEVPMPETMFMRRVIERAQGLEIVDPETRKYLQKTGLSQEADRIGHFTRLYWSIHQLLWRNKHIAGLRHFVEALEMFNEMMSRWHTKADRIARDWENTITDPQQRADFSTLMFWLTEMRYRSPEEVADEIVRHPTGVELVGMMRRLKFTPEMNRVRQMLYLTEGEKARLKAESIFGQFLTEIEQVSIANIIRTVSDPIRQAEAIQKVADEMRALRQKPYFPITRFGKHLVIVKDTMTNATQHIEAFYTLSDAQAGVRRLGEQFSGSKIQSTTAPEEVFEFMGLPAPLLRQIRENMPGLNADQIAWIEDFERLNLPDTTFRKRWLPQSGTPGYSMDAFRVFSHYFMNGSRYLARLKYGWLFHKAIGEVRSTIDPLPTSQKRRMIVDYMIRLTKYIMEGGRDYAKVKSFIALWQLGGSVAAAGMNLTQTPTVTLSYLMGLTNSAIGGSQLLKSIKAAKQLRSGVVVSGHGNYYSARQEAINQGRIDIGQAAELGAYAEGNNLLGLMAGTKAQKAYRKTVFYSMWMFQKAEQANREIAFHAAWEIAHTQKDHPKVKAALQEIFLLYPRQIAQLRERLNTPEHNFTVQDAVAFLYAKEAVDKTQGIYAPYARPEFLRNPQVSVVLIFFQFMQMMTYAYRFNPGVVQLLLISTFLYGVSGAFPGAEDLMEIVAAVGRRLFGVDWDVKQHARAYIRDMTRGTVLDEVGPDLFLHGISKYGFGLGWLPEGYGVGRIDVSGNGSLGKLVPGVFETAHAIKTMSDPDAYISDMAERLAGPGFGWMFAFIQWQMENRGATDSHTWEKLLPRAGRSATKALRMYGDGGETTSGGVKIAEFDVTDPDDLQQLVAQALGFAPTKVTTAWEVARETRDELQVYKARRTALYAQYARALRSPEKGVIEDVQAAIKGYNEEVRKTDPTMVITGDQIKQSMQARTRARVLGERGLPQQKSQMPVARRIQELFPGYKPVRP